MIGEIALAVLGTVAGTGIGAFVTWKVQERQLQHQDQTRFHERRIVTYAAYMEATTLLGAELMLSGSPDPKTVESV